MLQVESKSKFAKSLLFAMGLIFFSQATFAGGDTYTIYLNNKQILKQFVGVPSSGLLNLPLQNANPNDRLTIKYSHCGVVGKGRNIVIKNEQHQILKEWKFADGPDMSMTIEVKDILELKKKNPDASLNLYYSSAELMPKGLMLASLKMEKKEVSHHNYQLPVMYALAVMSIALVAPVKGKFAEGSTS